MFTFNSEGRSIARIKSGKRKGEILAILSDIPEHSDKYFTQLILNSGEKLEIIPSVSMSSTKVTPCREIVYACGPSGSGKSTFCATYISNFTKLFKDTPVYVVSRLEEDPVLDKLDIIRVPIDDSWLSSPPDIHTEVPAGSLFVFDDCDTIPDPKIKDAVTRFMMDILETGRHNNIYCLITSHVIAKEKRAENARIMNELHRLVLFPLSGNRLAMQKILNTQFGFGMSVVNAYLDIPKHFNSRWICFGKNYPLYLMHENGAIMA